MLSDSQRILIVSVMLTTLLWVIESFFLYKLSGNVKRGFRIWSKTLSDNALELFRKFDEPANYFIEPFMSGGNIYYSFIVVRDNEAIISPAHHLLFPCVAYVNLSKTHPSLEYRVGISHFFVFVIAFTYSAYLIIPFFTLVLIINYWIEIRSIDNFLNKKMRIKLFVK